jgi:hypothetical protein
VPKKKAKLPLSKTHPKLAKEADGWDPQLFYSGSKQRVSWRCSKNHIWMASLSNRALLGSNCPFCVGKSVWPGFNDLLTTHPSIAQEADGWDPQLFSPGSDRSMRWKCKNNHKWKTRIRERTRIGRSTNCPYCSRRKIINGISDLNSLYPEIAQEASDWNPAEMHPGSHKRMEWKCKLGHKWKATVDSRVNLNATCPICSGHKRLSGFNDLLTTHPQIAVEADGWDPSTVQKGTRQIKSWKCKNGHKWRTSPNGRTTSNSGCPTCAEFGYDPNADGYLYFIAHSDWAMYQIGITNFPKSRLTVHSRLGWDLVEIRGPMDGLLAQQWETAILHMLKVKGADLSNSKIAGKFDGYSEAWSKTTFPVKSIKELMRLTEEFEERK